MIASTWYCIAQTSTFDTGCTINVAFDGHDIQFSASVKFGMSAINITRCNIPYDTVFSLRLREGASQWFVDIFCNKEITPNITIADSPYWAEVSTTAGEGNVILVLNDISSKYNTEQGGGTGGLDIDQLKGYLDDNGYTEAKNFWSKEGDETIRTRHNIVVEKGGAFGRGSETNITFGRLDNWEDWDASTMMFYTLSASLGVNLNERLKYVEQNGSGLNEDDLRQYLTSNNYLQEADITDLRVTVKGLDDILNGGTKDVIDTWNEVVAFLDGYSQSDDLAAILSGMNEDISNRVLTTDFEKANDSIKDLLSYFDANGNANNALKLGGYTADYFATATSVSGLSTDLGRLSGNLSAAQTDITTLKGYFTSGKANYAIKDKNGNDIVDTYATKTSVNTIADNLADVTGRVDVAEDTLKTYGDSIAKNATDIAANAKAISVNETAILNLDSRVDKLEGYWYIDENGNLHTDYNIVVEGGGAFGKGSGGGGDVPSGGGINETQLWNILGKSGTQTIHSSHIPDLSGKYLPLSGGTISSDGVPLSVNRTNGSFSLISYKCVDVTVGNLGFNQNGDLVVRPQFQTNTNYYNIYHSGNFNPADYLPLSGGTMSGLLTIKRDLAGIRFLNSSGESLGWIGFLANNTPVIYNSGGTESKYLLHSGNIGSQKVERAKYIETLAANGASWYGDSYRIYGQWASETTLDWKVDGYEVRVDKAKKLNTARTIWGQSFDGSGNIEVTTIGRMRYLAFTNADGSENIGYIGRGSSTVNTVYLSSYDNPLSVTTNNGGIYINNSGNVLIGATADSGYKLDVNGSLNATTIYQNGTAIGSLAFKSSLVASDIPNLSWSKITSGKPTTLSGYGITDAIGTSGGTITGSYGALSIKRSGAYPSLVKFENTSGTLGYLGFESANTPVMYKSDASTYYTLLHSNNYSSYALPLSGGTITGDNTTPFAVNTLHSKEVGMYLKMSGSNVGWLGYTPNVGIYLYTYGNPNHKLGISDEGVGFIDSNTLIHSGNIGSQSVSHATSAEHSKLITRTVGVLSASYDLNNLNSGGCVYNYSDYNLWLNGPTGMSYGHVWNLRDDIYQGLAGQLAWDVNHASTTDTTKGLWWRASDDGTFIEAKWHQIAFTDSNVASANYATKALALVNNSTEQKSVVYASSSTFYVGDNIFSTLPTHILGKEVVLRYGSKADTGLTLDSVGNVNITNAVTINQRVQIPTNGDRITFNSTMGTYTKGILAMNENNTYLEAPLKTDSSTGERPGIFFGWRNGYAMAISSAANVLIGTTTDNGNKLQVAGSAYIDGNINLNLHEITNAKAIHCYDSGKGYYVGGRNYGLGVTDGGALVYAYGATPISFYTNATEQMRILGNGNILMGTTADIGYQLQVQGAIAILSTKATPTTSNKLRFIRNTSTDDYWDFGLYAQSTKGLTFFQSSMGVDTDIAYLTGNGDLVVTGGGAFGSDIRYKDITSYRQLDLATIADAPLFTYKWNDREDKVEHLGTSAQYWLDTQFRDAVNTANKDFYHLDYGALAVGIGISVAREVKGVKTEVQLLREKVSQLEQELAQYRRV